MSSLSASSTLSALPPTKKKTTNPSGIFHRRSLPKICIDLASVEGQRRFISSIYTKDNDNNNNNNQTTHPGYVLNLLSQFRTQDEPSYCGISTLVMCLNTLMVDPGQTWKGVWRWWNEEQLDCCISLEEAKMSGITLDEFVCLARCQGVDAHSERPPSRNKNIPQKKTTTQEETEALALSSTETESYASFTSAVLHAVTSSSSSSASSSSTNEVLVVSYDRKTLGQTGSGHFSPLGAFDVASNSVLILDVARFKYPPHWVPLPLLWEAMRTHDTSTNKPRGWVVLTTLQPNIPLLMRINISSRNCGCLFQFVKATASLLNEDQDKAAQEGEESNDQTKKKKKWKDDCFLSEIVERLLLNDSSCCTINDLLMLITERENVHKECHSEQLHNTTIDIDTAESTVKGLRGRILKQLHNTYVFKAVCHFLKNKDEKDENEEVKEEVVKEEVVKEVGPAERISMLIFLAFYEHTESSVGAISTLRGSGLETEIVALLTQWSTVHQHHHYQNTCNSNNNNNNNIDTDEKDGQTKQQCGTTTSCCAKVN